MVFDIGRICVKIAGRDAGGYCVIINKLDNNYVLVTGPKPLTGVRRRKVSLAHLEPVSEKVKLKADASDKDVLDSYKTADLYKKFNLRPLTADKLKEWETQRADKEARKKELARKAEEEKKKLEEKKVKEEKKKKEVKAKPGKDDVKLTEEEKKLIEEAEKEVTGEVKKIEKKEDKPEPAKKEAPKEAKKTDSKKPLEKVSSKKATKKKK